MITIVCGEDNVASREYFIELQNKYRKEGCEIESINTEGLKELQGTEQQSQNLFGFKRVFSIENLNKHLGRRKGDELSALLTKVDQNKHIVLLSWEDSVSARELKTGKLGTIKEFKPPQNVFKLLEACYPSNLASFIHILDQITTPRSEMFVYIMLTRHLRTLLLASEGEVSPRLAPWQRSRILSQVGRWKKESLQTYYQKLIGIDFALKSGHNLYGVKKSIEMLSSYYIS